MRNNIVVTGTAGFIGRYVARHFSEYGINALVANDPAQFANYVLSLLTDFQLTKKLSREVKRTFDQEYSTPAIYSKLDEMFGIKNIL